MTQALETVTIFLRQSIQEKEMHWKHSTVPLMTRARTLTESHLIKDCPKSLPLGLWGSNRENLCEANLTQLRTNNIVVFYLACYSSLNLKTGITNHPAHTMNIAHENSPGKSLRKRKKCSAKYLTLNICVALAPKHWQW